MKNLRQKTYLFALLAVLAFFAGCKGESSPTAPPTSTNPGGGGVTPPTGAAVTLTVSNANPFISGTSTVTATVTQNGQPVPNGTAVEFTTDFGTFVETAANAALRTTTNGVATVTLTSPTAGKATIQAVVNNVAKTTSVTFKIQDVVPCPPNCPPIVPSITSISPTFGSPAGGETVTITGQNLTGPVRVFFDFGAGTTPKEAFVVSSTASQIVVVTPPTDLGTGQTKNATIVVLTQAGTTSEQRVTSGTPFVFQAEVLTPSITTLSPASGPIDGGTRVTIFGDAFQAPVQVFFGSAEAQVVTVSFKQLIVMSPTARDTATGGSGTVTGAVDVKVININSNKTATLAGGFRYTPKMQITAVGPTQGPATGGTKVVIDGIGFNDPVAVVIGGFAAAPIKVTGTQVTAVTSAIALTSCADVTGPITVTNIDNGDQAPGPNFTYKVPKPVIISVSPTSVSPGASITIQVANAVPGTTKITVGDKAAFITNASTNATTNVTTFTATIASNFTFQTQPCTAGGVTGTQNVPLSANVVYLNLESGCTDTATGALQINPASVACVVPPPPNGVVSPTPPTCAATVPVSPSATDPATGTATITVLNTAPAGSQSLTITNASFSSVVNGNFSVNPTTATIAPGGNQVFTITVDPAASGPFSATLNFTSNNPASLSGCVSGTAVP
ncbi:MAG TPA: IPT/TIG domain-containing protein [Thermoanaerobaculia bacterium]|nr:IPT/TIG domain-containing protein [Thermoanaerobaculia bacterium]